MGLKVDEHKDAWYFSNFGFLGLGAERTLAIYKPRTRQLTITRKGFRKLTAVFRYLKEHLDASKITVIWYKEREGI